MGAGEFRVITHSEEETRAVGRVLGQLLQPGDVVALSGPLAAGKTRFVQGIASGLGITRPVTSPTFILMNVYRAPDGCILCHVDCYRMTDPIQEGYDIGLDQQVRGEEICVIEWAERVSSLLPGDHLWVEIDFVNEGARELRFIARGARSGARLEALKKAIEREKRSSTSP